VSADLRAFAARSSNSWVRFRRAILCLRSLLNPDLSPFSAQMMNSRHEDDLLTAKLSPTFGVPQTPAVSRAIRLTGTELC
jgi:hypothetical protein